ncbi:MAG: 50S ribosomal protein L10 [Patescibacteria group bacterium]
MAKSRAQKADSIEQLTEAFKKGKSVVFSDYQGMTVPKLSDLRKKLHNAEVDYIVAKKTVLNVAAKEAGLTIDFKPFPGMIGVGIAYAEEMAGAKIIGDAGKDAPIKIVGGYFEGKTVDQQYAVALSKLPSKDQLLGQLLSVLNGPAAAFVRVLNAQREKLEGVSS